MMVAIKPHILCKPTPFAFGVARTVGFLKRLPLVALGGGRGASWLALSLGYGGAEP